MSNSNVEENDSNNKFILYTRQFRLRDEDISILI